MDLADERSQATVSTSIFAGIGALVLPLILIVISATLILQLSGRRNSKPRNKNGFKSQRKIPFVSHFPVKLPLVVEGVYSLYRFRKDGLKFWEEMESKYGTIFEIPMANKTFICVFDPTAAQKILMSSNPQHLEKNNFFYDTVFVEPVTDGLVNAKYDIWSVHRKITGRCFTYKSLQTYLPIMNEHGKSLVNHLQSLCAKNSDNSVSGHHVLDTVWSETIKIIFQTIVGKDIFKNGGHEKLQDSMKMLKECLQYRLGHPYLLIKPLWNLHPMKKRLDKVLDYSVGVIQMVIDKFHKIRAAEDGKGKESIVDQEDSDVIGVKVFRSMLEEMLYSGASDKEVLNEVSMFAAAGHETVTIAISMLLFHLACNPECQKLCQEEMDQLFASIGSEKESDYNFTMDDLANLKYLERAILEGLRLTPAIPIFMRYLGAPLDVAEDLTLDGGSIVFFAPWCMHRNSDNFANPTKFDPDRFLPENAKHRHSLSFASFSTGPRNCIGYKYAMIETKTILALILRNFDVFTTDKPEDIKYFMEVSLMTNKDINIILKNRNF